jgi:RIO kinase 1
VIDFAELNALAKGTAYGKELQQTSWLSHENEMLTLLHGAGADVPQPFACGANAILMTYMGDADSPAPTLNKVKLDRRQARTLFDRLIANVELMLKHQRIHGDLSAFNVLYWEGEIMIIDFPQAIDPRVNSQARKIFTRDVRRLCDYFDRYGVAADSKDLADAMWKRYVIEKEDDVVDDEE